MLGKGLESLIPNRSAPPEPTAEKSIAPPAPRLDAGEAIFHIETDKISPNPFQPRRNFDEAQLHELAASIREFGIIQPLIVSKIEKETPYGTAIEYQLIAGERRLMAAKIAGLPRVPAIVRRAPEDKEKFEMAIVENVQRADLNPIESARSYAKLQEQFGMTQREIASRMGKSRETIANATRLLNLPSEMQDAIAGGKISESQGRVLLAVSDLVKQKYLFEQVMGTNVSVREMKNTIARMNRSGEIIGENPLADGAAESTEGFVRFGAEDEFAKLARELQATLRTPVRIERAGDRTKITIDFSSEDDLRALIAKMNSRVGGSASVHATDAIKEANDINETNETNATNDIDDIDDTEYGV